MKIKKVSQSAGLIAQVEQNLDSNSEVNAPSVKAVKNALSYSTEEQVIGTWMGKPLYRKVFTVDSLPNATAITIDTNLSNITVVRLYGGTTSASSGNFFPLPFIGLYTENTSMELVWLNVNKQVRITTQSDRSDYDAYFVLEYTKTTD